MATQQALDFLRHVEAHPQVQQRLAALKGRSALEDLVTIAAEEGFTFTAEEYRAAVVSLAEGELDDDALQEIQRELGM